MDGAYSVASASVCPEAYDAVARSWSSAVRAHMIKAAFDLTDSYDTQDETAFDLVDAALSTQPDFKRVFESSVDSMLVFYEHVLPRWAPGDPRLARAQASARKMATGARAADDAIVSLVSTTIDTLDTALAAMDRLRTLD